MVRSWIPLTSNVGRYAAYHKSLMRQAIYLFFLCKKTVVEFLCDRYHKSKSSQRLHDSFQKCFQILSAGRGWIRYSESSRRTRRVYFDCGTKRNGKEHACKI